ncbi:MAG: aminotransferase class I/II-fold pyridoxal phosphate-dependent enzyme [Actinomycetia bacterium]|nr:aminotransferase class I/II-fold pyridoxal phosphate-dependent enzyme [Actinomycetes bacterium]MCP4960979.1 aminotransferase class I/II-fold pyridoxal phosphate-dependent enzyme [Actinomycetes bacterium]
MEVMRSAAARAAAGADVVHLEVGQPGTRAPSGVITAAHRALDDDVLGYTVALGDDTLRHSIAGHYRDWYDVSVDADRIVVTQGSSGAFVLTFLAAFAPGSRVAIPAPGYAAYRNMLVALDIEPVIIEVGAGAEYVLTPDHLASAGHLDGAIIASPNNPTGTMLDEDQLMDLASWCDHNGVTLVSDEIYHGITFGNRAHTAIDLPGQPIVVNSFSKYFSMTGWRLGWVILPADLLTPVERLAQNLTIAPPTLAQIAARAAFDCHDELRRNVALYEEHRSQLLSALTDLGFLQLAPADGAFYVWSDVSHLTDDSQVLCRTWLDELGVATTPGLDFDPNHGHRFIRFSYAGTTRDITEAIDRIATWLDVQR